MNKIIYSFCCLFWLAVAKAQEAQHLVTVTLNEKNAGRMFEGIGGVSAGASSELLIDYAEPYRSQVLDYLFKPKFGAALQQLKVEIGADAVVVGAEASHARTLHELHYPKKKYYERGYEYWLMKEAKGRNPNLIFCALEWAIPAYLTGHWTKENAEYITQFIKGAKDYWDIDMQYISPGKNESPINGDWLKGVFKPTLNKNGLSKVKILGPDDIGRYWEFCEELKDDSALASAVNAVGYHYVYSHLPQLHNENNATTETAKGLHNISLWASEDWSMLDGSWKNAHVLAGILNKMYIRDRITAMQIWDPVDGYYDNTGEWKSTGLMQADQPWSGFYDVWPAIWATAHFTQFTEVGWRYIDSGCGYFDTPSGSNYTSLYNPRTHDFSTIIYTDTNEVHTKLTLNLEGMLSKPEVYIWMSNQEQQFQMIHKVQVKNNAVVLEVEPGSIYTISSTTGQQKGTFTDAIKKTSSFPFPYNENFNNTAIGKNPRYFADIQGAFEVENDVTGKNKCLRQQIIAPPLNWTYYTGFQPSAGPLTELGDQSWGDYSLSADVQLPGKGFAQIIARMNKLPGYTEGYVLKLYHNGYWELLLNSNVTLAAGKINRKLQGWHNLKLICKGDMISVVIDGGQKKVVKNNIIKSGMAGLGCSWDKVRFDNFEICQIQ